MFGHKSFLKIGSLDDASIVGLYNSSYELGSCNYGFSQGVNSDDKMQAGQTHVGLDEAAQELTWEVK